MLIFDTQEILRRFFAVNGDILLKRVRCWHKCEASLKNIGFVEGCGVIFIKITKLCLQRGENFTLSSDRQREISRNSSAMRTHFLRSSFCFSFIALLMFSIFGFFTSFSHFLYSLYQKFWTFSNERADGREAARKIPSTLPSVCRTPAQLEASLENSIRFQIFEGNHSKFSRISNNISRFQIFE